MKNWGRYLLALLLIAAGINHFRMPETYMRIMPPYLPLHWELVILSGVAELGLGILLLFERTKRIAAWGTVALLIAVFPANVYMYQVQATEFPDMPSWILLLRLPLQFLMIAWAYRYTRR